jgi:hypothetical protein
MNSKTLQNRRTKRITSIKNEKQKENITFRIEGFKTKLVNKTSSKKLEKLLDEI